ncbi:uncharacterized protein L969DRAFT_346801 [Mixia osmundae IAM 14324]|uniref:uncharacterized protein n=1 Tax=Mixia osmundae (strain CBS 9802 / IAM 14324 / JCM 22182 / KY 12970) TaxID=764103 RepID=UPI0004A553E6|nr:uncharacterized protein L969DRAFT_346801 [Mixia osmundae IAM 14324]KEI40657.1 hypothetical protein L969DRAFT_346801 [Mixia osmundae IAM 14324]
MLLGVIATLINLHRCIAPPMPEAEQQYCVGMPEITTVCSGRVAYDGHQWPYYTIATLHHPNKTDDGGSYDISMLFSVRASSYDYAAPIYCLTAPREYQAPTCVLTGHEVVGQRLFLYAHAQGSLTLADVLAGNDIISEAVTTCCDAQWHMPFGCSLPDSGLALSQPTLRFQCGVESASEIIPSTGIRCGKMFAGAKNGKCEERPMEMPVWTRTMDRRCIRVPQIS